MSANATAKLTLNLSVLGAGTLRALAADLTRLGTAARTGGGEAAAGLGRISTSAAAQAAAMDKLQYRLQRALQQQTAAQAAADAARLRGAEKVAAQQLKIRERAGLAEDRLLRRQAAARARAGFATLNGAERDALGTGAGLSALRARLAGDPLAPPAERSGLWLTGHGFSTRPRQVLGLLRDMTVAGMGLRFALQGTVGAVSAMVNPAREFERSLATARMKGDFTLAETAGIAASARLLGRTTQFGAREAAAAAIPLAASNIKAGDIQRQMGTVLNFALASDLGTEASADVLTQTAAQFQMKPGAFGHIADVLTKSANMSTVSVDDLSESLKYLGSFAGGMKVPLEDVAAMLSLIGQRGIKGSLGGTALRQMLVGLTTPARQAKKAMAELGYTTADLNEGLKDVPRFMVKLNNDMDRLGLTLPQRGGIIKRLFGVESISAVQAMVSGVMDQGVTGWAAYRGALNDVNGETRRSADMMGNTLDGKIKRLKASVEDLQISLGQGLAPVLSERILPALSRAALTTGDWAAANGPLIGSLAAGIPTAIGALLAQSLSNSLVWAPLTKVLEFQGVGWGMSVGHTFGNAFLTSSLGIIMAGVQGWALGSIIAKALNMEQVGAAIWEAMHPGEKYPTSSRVRQTDEAAVRAKVREDELGATAPLLEATDDPLLQQYRNNRLGEMMGDPIMQGMHNPAGAPESLNAGKPWAGLLKIEITHEGKPRVTGVETTGPDVDVGATVMP